MKTISRTLAHFLLLLLFCLPGTGRGEERPPRMSVSVQCVTTQGKTYSTEVTKTSGMTTFPLSVSETARWLVLVQKNSDETDFYVSITDPSLRIGQGNGVQPYPLEIFSAYFEAANGKKITILKTDQYTIELTLTLN